MKSAGSLGYGCTVFLTAKLPGHIRIGRDDLIDQYLFLSSTHDGTGSITIAFTPIRVYCANTLQTALKDCHNAIKIRHTACAAEKLKSAHLMLGLTNTLSIEFEAIFNRWSRIRISDPELKQLIRLAIAPKREALEPSPATRELELSSRSDNVVSAVWEYALSDPTQLTAETRGTLYGFYNAIGGYYQHVCHYRDEERKFRSMIYGNALQKTQSAFSLCADFARHGQSVLWAN